MSKKYTFSPVPAPLPVFKPLVDEEGQPMVRVPRNGEIYFEDDRLYVCMANYFSGERPIYFRDYPPRDAVQVEPTGEIREPDPMRDIWINCEGRISGYFDGLPYRVEVCHGDLGTRRVILREVK